MSDFLDGAALFYTTPLPATLQVLRQYALHLLFAPPAPPPGVASGTDAGAPVRNPFPFQHKSNTLDRDRIVVPAGWDSWGKIAVMREGFDAKLWGEAWERDLDASSSDVADDLRAKKHFAILVPDRGPKVSSKCGVFLSLIQFSVYTQHPPLPPFNNPMPEQTFLAKNFDENAKKPDRDPRGAFRNPADFAGASAGIVGPLGSSSFNLPNVERALTEMEVGMGGTSNAGGDAARRLPGRVPGRPPPSALSAAAASPTLGRQPASPTTLIGSPSPTGGQTQHEVLQNFFQSLLTSKDRTGTNSTASAARKTSVQKTNGAEESS